ncbi:hypothetical protein [Agathobacter sp.]|uniref:hypothetical protein n=1 Tax=Agathobacter sp. TaxID=2021311 RepID=UPI003FD86030
MQIDGYSLDAQKTKMKAFCDYNEYEIADEYEDAGKSGKSTHIALWRKYPGEQVKIINGDKPILWATGNLCLWHALGRKGTLGEQYRCSTEGYLILPAGLLLLGVNAVFRKILKNCINRYRKQMEICGFLYAQFKECYITYDAIKNNLPRKWHNLTRDLCRDLGLEALHAGDDENFRKYYFEEKRANERYYLKKFHHSKTEDGGYYYRKYNVWDECSGFFHFLLSKLNHVSWAYEFASVSEAGIGVIFVGFFVAAVFRYINRRS